MLASIVFIKAAILSATGVSLDEEDIIRLLLEEDMITPSQVRYLLVPNLNELGDSYVSSTPHTIDKHERNIASGR